MIVCPQVQVTVRRTKGLVGQVQVRYTTSPGTATTGQEFYPAAGVLVFENGVDSKFVTVSLQPDDIPEGPETFFINITSVQLLSPRYWSVCVCVCGLCVCVCVVCVCGECFCVCVWCGVCVVCVRVVCVCVHGVCVCVCACVCVCGVCVCV